MWVAQTANSPAMGLCLPFRSTGGTMAAMWTNRSDLTIARMGGLVLEAPGFHHPLRVEEEGVRGPQVQVAVVRSQVRDRFGADKRCSWLFNSGILEVTKAFRRMASAAEAGAGRRHLPFWGWPGKTAARVAVLESRPDGRNWPRRRRGVDLPFTPPPLGPTRLESRCRS